MNGVEHTDLLVRSPGSSVHHHFAIWGFLKMEDPQNYGFQSVSILKWSSDLDDFWMIWVPPVYLRNPHIFPSPDQNGHKLRVSSPMFWSQELQRLRFRGVSLLFGVMASESWSSCFVRMSGVHIETRIGKCTCVICILMCIYNVIICIDTDRR